MTNREAFVTILRVLTATFGVELAPAALEGYWIALQGLTEAEFKKALGRALAECKFMPKPAELLAFVGAAPPDSKAAALLCWEQVRRAIDKHDYMVNSIDFGPRVNAVIWNLGGWDTLCKASLPELDSPGWLRKRFCEVYEAFAPLPIDSLRGEALSGALPPRWSTETKDVFVAIAGEPPAKALPPRDPLVAKHIAELAEAKS